MSTQAAQVKSFKANNNLVDCIFTTDQQHLSIEASKQFEAEGYTHVDDGVWKYLPIRRYFDGGITLIYLGESVSSSKIN